MPPTTAYSFGDVVLVPFPFTDQSGIKRRPAVIVSSAQYQSQRRDPVIMAITSQIRPHPAFGEFMVAEWKKAGLILEPAAQESAAGEAPLDRGALRSVRSGASGTPVHMLPTTGEPSVVATARVRSRS
jgi:PemK-like, MazF-like toxin of type II toxin-antitoxin system